ncbi:MAG: hypothetical protein K2H67_02055, partial [Treponemataceae bacterium]|nr:hypothetical protein [Treponemataceae bacterium]
IFSANCSMPDRRTRTPIIETTRNISTKIMHELNKINFFLMVKMTHLHPYTHFGKASQDINGFQKFH